MGLAHAEPINTYNGWKQLGRQVKKAKKQLHYLCQLPLKTRKMKPSVRLSLFAVQIGFGLSQTEGADYVVEVVPGFSVDAA